MWERDEMREEIRERGAAYPPAEVVCVWGRRMSAASAEVGVRGVGEEKRKTLCTRDLPWCAGWTREAAGWADTKGGAERVGRGWWGGQDVHEHTRCRRGERSHARVHSDALTTSDLVAQSRRDEQRECRGGCMNTLVLIGRCLSARLTEGTMGRVLQTLPVWMCMFSTSECRTDRSGGERESAWGGWSIRSERRDRQRGR